MTTKVERSLAARVFNIPGYVIAWAARRHLPRYMWEDMVQEAHVAALEHDHDMQAISRALHRYRMREYATPIPVSAMGANIRLEYFAG